MYWSWECTALVHRCWPGWSPSVATPFPQTRCQPIRPTIPRLSRIPLAGRDQQQLFAGHRQPLEGSRGTSARCIPRRQRTRCAIADHGFYCRPAGTLSCLKDPRLCRLLPLWLPVLRTTAKHVFVTRGTAPRRGICLAAQEGVGCRPKGGRHPIPHHSDLIWWRYNLDAIVHSQGLPSLVFTYEQLIGSPKTYAGN